MPIDDDLTSDKPTQAANQGSDKRKPNTMPANPQNTPDIQNGSTGEGVLKSIGFEPVPNPMGEVLQPTYHFSFYLDSDVPAEQGKGGEFVIAETGLTGMNIQEVLIDAVVGPNQNTKNAMTTNLSIKIYEPYGAMLPDLLYQAAATKQIRNYLKAPWFLKLKLWGYDETGKVQTIGDGWTWQLTLIDVASTISENGSMHTITAMPMSEQAFNNQYCMLPNTATGEGSTVGDALKQIIEQMNQAAIGDYGRSSTPFIQYAVEAKDYPYDTKVGVKNPFDHPITASNPTQSNQGSASGHDTQRGQFPPGTDFPAVVDQVMARSETAIKMARLSRELPPTTGDDDETTIRDIMSIMHRIDTKVEYGPYNPVQGDYSKKITYIIKPYSSLRILSSMGRAQKFDKDPNLNKKKAQFAKDNAFLKKQYDYIFTGLNTEVLKFDINVNFTWAVAVPMLQAQNTNTGTPAQVDLTKNAAATSQQNAALKVQIDDTQTKLDELNGQDPNTLTEEQKTSKANLESNLQTLKSQKSAVEDRLGKLTDQQQAALPRRESSVGKDRITDGEDLVYENAQDKNFQGAEQNAASFLPITIAPDSSNPGLRAQGGTSEDNNGYKSVYGTLLNQLYGTMDGNLQSIQLDIKGDPYWLGPGDNGLPFDAPSTDDRPNFMNGEHIFVFRFKLPRGYDEATGTVNVAPDAQQGGSGAGGSADTPNDPSKGVRGNSNIFTGFYACVQVNNRFSQGQFTQTLQATRIPGWSYENIIEGRETAVADNTVFDNRAGPSSPAVSGPQAGAGGQGNTGFTPQKPSGTLASRSKTVYNELKRRGYSDVQIAAIMGSWQQESTLSPTSLNGIGAYGLGQWLGPRRQGLIDYANQRGLDYRSTSTQVGFFEHELNTTETRAGNALKSSTTLDQAMRAMNSYERFGKNETGQRYNYMNQHYANIKGGLYS